ncbi:MAG: regulatory protein RecX, partial [Sphaerochaeta sp.]|nr:regulatory protein RecX [Sphaerochaeta sp.]
FRAVPQEGSPFSIPSELFVSKQLFIGQELCQEEFFHLKELQEQHLCKMQAMTYLARREHTTFELKIKLQKKSFSSRCIQNVLDVLKEENLLSEVRYALQFIESRQRKNPEGRALMSQRLAAKGVDREAAERALDELYTEEQIIDYVERAYALALRKVGEEKARMMLSKKGFSSYEVRLGLERLF